MVPGPGQYQSKDALSANGQYIVSNLKASLARHFGKEKRDQVSTLDPGKDRIPGPGAYALPTEFGNYSGPVTKSHSAVRAHRRNVTGTTGSGAEKPEAPVQGKAGDAKK